MRIEVRCTSCGKTSLVDEREARDATVCGDCATEQEQKREQKREREREREREQAARAAPSVAPDREVVCPRCKLHFVPRERDGAASAEPRHAVLVVEDMEYFRQVARSALEPRYDVRTAVSVREGLAVLSERRIDLVVLDLTLEGGEEGRQLLSYAAGTGCPVLIYTAKDESEIYGESWDELRRLGARDIVIKGMQVGESLARKADEILGVPADDAI